MKKLIYISIALLFLGCSNFTTFKSSSSSDMFIVPCTLNNVVKIDMMLDSGAGEVNITPDILLVLIRAKTIKKEHFLQPITYILADGSRETCQRVLIERLYIKGKVIKNVECSVSNNINAPLLVGNNALKQLNKVFLKYE
jgi:predicted aspartyl protease